MVKRQVDGCVCGMYGLLRLIDNSPPRHRAEKQRSPTSELKDPQGAETLRTQQLQHPPPFVYMKGKLATIQNEHVLLHKYSNRSEL